mgnify:CR=1 FL=1
MTKGYFVIEGNGKIRKATYLVSDAYLDNGYGEQIIRAFAEKRELEFLEQTYQKLDLTDKRIYNHYNQSGIEKQLIPIKEIFFQNIAYVVRKEKLRVYHYGKLLFCLKREDAEIWLYLLENMQQLVDYFLYSDERLEYQWEKYFSMFQFLQKKIEEGFCQQEFQQYMRKEGKNLAFFRDEHLVDVWDRYDRPAYQKNMEKRNREILFIVTKAGAYLESIHTRSV